jgi:hypothetical protein
MLLCRDLFSAFAKSTEFPHHLSPDKIVDRLALFVTAYRHLDILFKLLQIANQNPKTICPLGSAPNRLFWLNPAADRRSSA